MRRFELGMNLEYAKDWTVVDAVREFYQNALDEEAENPDNAMSFSYDENTKTIIISNKKSKLTPKSLLLGESSKRGKDNLIGQHGEGYKVATVVLMRNGITVTIYNNENKEVWTSSLVRSRRYDSNIVVFDIEKKIFQKESNLVVELQGITPEMYSNIVESNLHLRDDVVNVKDGESGRILLDSQFSGCIYVEGLFVCHKEEIQWGYDFKANVVKLDRDRGLVDTTDLKFVIARLIMGLTDVEFVSKNINNPDLRFVHVYLDSKVSTSKKLSDKVYSDFVDKYGDDSIPVDSTEEFNIRAKAGMKPVMVDTNVKNIIVYNDRGFASAIQIKSDVDKRFEDWLKRSKVFLPSSYVAELLKLWVEKGESCNDGDKTSG